MSIIPLSLYAIYIVDYILEEIIIIHISIQKIDIMIKFRQEGSVKWVSCFVPNDEEI